MVYTLRQAIELAEFDGNEEKVREFKEYLDQAISGAKKLWDDSFCMVTEKNQEKKYPFGRSVTCGPGEISVSIHAGCIEAGMASYMSLKRN